MTKKTIWVLEYSISKKEFQISEANRCLEDNMHCLMLGEASTYMLIGIFDSKQAALSFCAKFHTHLGVNTSPNAKAPASLQKAAGKFVTYQTLVILLCRELKQKPYGFIKQFCKEAGLTYQTVISLTNNKLMYPTPMLLFTLVESLGYGVRMHKRTYYELNSATGRNLKVPKEEIFYYFNKESNKGEKLTLHRDTSW